MLKWFKSWIGANAPRGAILSFDILLAILSFAFSTFVLFTLNDVDNPDKNFFYVGLMVVFFRVQGYLITRSYQGVLKYTSSQDAIRLAFSVLLSSLGIAVFGLIYEYFTQKRLIPYSLQVIDFFVLMALLSTVRISVKLVYQSLKSSTGKLEDLVIFGAGESGLLTKKAIDSNPNLNYRVVAYFDDDPKLESKRMEGIRIYNPRKEFESVLQKFNPKTLIISARTIQPRRLEVLVNQALASGLKIKRAPSTEKWVRGEFDFNQIESVRIEDLLGRDPIVLKHKHIGKYINGKRVLITGAAGSIGSELVRQCIPFSPAQLILLDQAETPLHELQIDLAHHKNCEVVIADVCNEHRMKRVFDHFKPEVVFHAAAYKHVPLMEENPFEAVNTNVFGTRITANLSVQFKVDKFVLISTDKAVNPTNIMGATKRIAEMYVQSLNHKNLLDDDAHTKFITTRFGNVLGSNGSVIPLFKKQIEKGGPITVTHPDITRFFMTIPEACQLVLEAGAMGSGGEIFIFDMGQSVRIVDLAKRMIELSGYVPGKDIEIVFTGLRPGEKLKEELLADLENTVGTYHPKIMIARVPAYNYLEVNHNIEELYRNKDTYENSKMVSIMKSMVPEFLSQNSVYQKLDEPSAAR